MAIANLRQSEIHTAFDNVTFVNFNYDRCIEHYIYWSFQRLGLNEAESARIVASLKMIRPYGGLGTSLPAVHGHLAFGYHSHADFFELINRIRTYTESAVHDSNILEDALHRAELILILGFGFHAQNLNLLRLDQPREARVIATVKNLDRANLVDITDALIRTLRIAPEQIELFDMTTPELLQNLRLKILRRTSAD